MKIIKIAATKRQILRLKCTNRLSAGALCLQYGELGPIVYRTGVLTEQPDGRNIEEEKLNGQRADVKACDSERHIGSEAGAQRDSRHQ